MPSGDTPSETISAPSSPIIEVDEEAYEAQFRGQTVSVYQRIEPTFCPAETFEPTEYQLVAVISDTNLAEAFALTNSVGGRWQSTDDPRLDVLVSNSRNTSIGDVFYVAETDAYKVATKRGFEDVYAADRHEGVSV